MVSDPSTGPDTVGAIVYDGGYVFVAGADESQGSGDSQWRIEKRQASGQAGDGSLDPAFGSGGVVTSNPSTGADAATALTSDGTYLYIAGFDSTSGDRRWRIEKRRLLDGALDGGFGATGVLTVNPSTGRDEVTAILRDSANLYVVGFDEGPGAGDTQWRMEKRVLGDGSLVTGFGTGGVATSNPSLGGDIPNAAAGDSTLVYIGGYDSAIGSRQWRVEVRRTNDGALNASFALSGVLVADPSTGIDEITALSITGGALHLVGFDESPGSGDSQWRVEQRNLGSGALVSSFGSGGVVTSNPSSGADAPSYIYAGSFGFWVAGTDYSPGPLVGDSQWRIERRGSSTGALDSSYGQGGVVTSNPTAGDDRITDGAFVGWTVFAGTQNGPGNTAWRLESRG